MSLVSVHLRWNGVGHEQYEQVLSNARQSDELPAGCLSRQVRHHGRVLQAIEVWDSQVAGNRFDHLVRVVEDAGVEERPQTAMFAIPQIFASAYRRPARPAEITIPHQPGPPEAERVSDLPSRPADTGARPADRTVEDAADSASMARS